MNILKKIICGVLTATVGLAVLSFNTVSAYSFIPENPIRSGDYDYVVLGNDTACLVDYHGSEPNLVLPAQIDGKLISACTIHFKDAYYLETINFPDTIVELRVGFNGEYYDLDTDTGNYERQNLKYIHFNNVKEITYVGLDMANSGEIYMPPSITYILYHHNVHKPFHSNIPVIVESGSYAEQWAIGNPGFSHPYRLDNREWLEASTGVWYLMSGDQMMYGWHRMNDKMYYLDPHQNGVLLVGWQYLGNAWYYLDPLNGGAVACGWLQPDKSTGTWYYCDSYGIMKTGWIFNENTWYYLDPLSGGAMRTGWIHLDSGWYYLAPDGSMLTNTTTPDGYYVDSNGVWIP